MKKVKRVCIILFVFCLFLLGAVSAKAAAPERPVMKKITVKSYQSLQLQWKKVKGATGYAVYRKTGKSKYKKIVTLSGAGKCSYLDKKLTPGTKYSYIVKAYQKSGKETTWSPSSKKVSAVPKLNTPAIVSVKTGGAGELVVKWKKVPGANGYVVYRKSAKGTYQKIKTIKKNAKTSFTDSKLENNKSYSYKVKAYRTVKKKKVYSSFSKKGKGKTSKENKAAMTRENLETQIEYIDKFLDMDKNAGSVDGEAEKDALIDEVYKAALSGKKKGDILSAQKEENGVAMQFSSGIWYIYQPEQTGIDASGSEASASIITLQPYQSAYSAYDQKESLEATDGAASKIAGKLDNYTFDQNYDNEQVTLDTIRNLKENQVVLCHTHGFYSQEQGSIIWVGEKISKAQLYSGKYAEDFTAGRLAITKDYNLGFTGAFVSKYCGNLNHAFIYLGACESGKDARLAQSFLSKGAAAVVANSETIYRGYNCDMMEDTVEGLLTEDTSTHKYYTLEQALAYAKKENGNSDYEWHPNDSHAPSIPLIFGDKDYRLSERGSVVPVTSVSVSPSSASVKVGDTLNLTAAIMPKDASDQAITWGSSNPGVATVDNTGKVTAIAVGTAAITAASGNGVKAACAVQVEPADVDAELVERKEEAGNSFFQMIKCKGGPEYAEIGDAYWGKNFYIRAKLKPEQYYGSVMRISYVEENSTEVIYTKEIPVQDMKLYDSEGGYGYYLLPGRYYYETKVRIYYEITSSNGETLHPANIGGKDAFFVNFICPPAPVVPPDDEVDDPGTIFDGL